VNAIEVRGLVKRYRACTALDGISFDVAEGELFCLLGPNGAGKTTTVSILTTILAPTSGEVRVCGVDLTQAREVRRKVGIVFQGPSLDVNLTAEENLRLHAVLYGLYPWRPLYRLMPGAYRARVDELAGLLDLPLGRPVRTLSGGNRRKLEIIRGLLHRPSILFLDEPTSGLDPALDRQLDETAAWASTSSPGLPVIWVQDQVVTGPPTLEQLQSALIRAEHSAAKQP